MLSVRPNAFLKISPLLPECLIPHPSFPAANNSTKNNSKPDLGYPLSLSGITRTTNSLTYPHKEKYYLEYHH